jgi:hypothetical protein
MWERTEITICGLQCTCGHLMKPMWEEKNDNQRSTVFHCEHCYEDRELIREFDSEGKVIQSRVMRYFFG